MASIADRVEVRDVIVLSEDWYTLKMTTFAFERADGSWQEQSRETYDRGNGAVILLYDPDRCTVALTRQFRYPAFVNGHYDLLIEAPAGLVDEASPEERIRTEVEEETGYCVREIVRLWDVFMSPGSVTERLFFFVGRYDPRDRTGEGGGDMSEGEDIEVMEVRFHETMAMVRTGASVTPKRSCYSGTWRCTGSPLPPYLSRRAPTRKCLYADLALRPLPLGYRERSGEDGHEPRRLEGPPWALCQGGHLPRSVSGSR